MEFVVLRWKILAIVMSISFVAAVLFAFVLTCREWGSFSVVRLVPANSELQNGFPTGNELQGLAAVAKSLDVAQAVIDETGIEWQPHNFHYFTQVTIRKDQPELLEFKLRWRNHEEGVGIVDAWVQKTLESANQFDKQRLDRTKDKLNKQADSLECRRNELLAEIAYLDQNLGGDPELAVQRDELALRECQKNLQRSLAKEQRFADDYDDMLQSSAWLSDQRVLLGNEEAWTDLQLTVYKLQDLDLTDVRSDTPVNRLLEDIDYAHLEVDLSKISEATLRNDGLNTYVAMLEYVKLRESQFVTARRLFDAEQNVALAKQQLLNRLATRRSIKQRELELSDVSTRRLQQQLRQDQLATTESLEDRAQLVVPPYQLHYPLRSNRKKLFVLGWAMFSVIGLLGVAASTREPNLPTLEVSEAHVVVERSEVYDSHPQEQQQESHSNTAT